MSNDKIKIDPKKLQEMEELFRTIKAVSLELDRRLKPILKLIRQAMEITLPSSEQLIEYFKGTHRNVLKHGWLLPLTGFSLGNINAVHSLALNNPVRLSDQLCQYLKQEGVNKEIQDRWGSNGYFKRRMIFLKRGLEAHLAGDYIASVPVLLPHIEGILSDYFEDSRITLPPKFNGNDAIGILGLFVLKDISHNIEKNTLSKFLHKLYETREEGENKDLNRGLILHGKCLDYHREDISARTIYALDTICYFIQSEVDEIKNGKRRPQPPRGSAAVE